MPKKKKDKEIIQVHQFNGFQPMRHGDFTCDFNMPPALKSKGESNDETCHDLPPFLHRKTFLVDDYPAHPDNWLTSEGKTKSFFVPVKEGEGMWLDFNSCNSKYHIAIVISIQGINPVTGMMCSDFYLEQYKEKCPKHNCKFGPDRYCEKCGYKWPKQNYLCTTGTPHGLFWLDGFRSADGVVRQYILTAEKMRGVAHNILGEEKVYAIGMTFFLSKEVNMTPAVERIATHHYHSHWEVNLKHVYDIYSHKHLDPSCMLPKSYFTTTGNTGNRNNVEDDNEHVFLLSSVDKTNVQLNSAPQAINKVDNVQCGLISPAAMQVRSVKQTKKLEIGAGAKIRQTVYDDPFELDYWRDDPEAVICVNYCIETDAEKIIEAGKRELAETHESFMKNIPVGN